MLSGGPDPRAGKWFADTARTNRERYEMRTRARSTAGRTTRPNLGALWNGEAEAALLGCVLRRPADAARVGRDLLTEERHLRIFDAIVAARSSDPCAVLEHVLRACREHHHYVLYLLDEDANDLAVSPGPLIRVLRDCRIRRHLDSILATLPHAIEDAHSNPRLIVETLYGQLGRLRAEETT